MATQQAPTTTDRHLDWLADAAEVGQETDGRSLLAGLAVLVALLVVLGTLL